MGAGEESGEKNFDASASKLQRLREQGSVPKSQEVGRVLTLAVAVIYLVAGSTYIWEKIYSMFIGLWSVIHLKNLSAMGAGFIIEHSFKPLAFIIERDRINAQGYYPGWHLLPVAPYPGELLCGA